MQGILHGALLFVVWITCHSVSFSTDIGVLCGIWALIWAEILLQEMGYGRKKANRKTSLVLLLLEEACKCV